MEILDQAASLDAAPIKVEVVNTSDFKEDLGMKLVAAVAVATVTVLTKYAVENWTEKRKQKKAEAKKTELTTVK